MKNRYVIYQCTAVRSDKTKLIRVIKIPAHFAAEDLGIALASVADEQLSLNGFCYENGGASYVIDYENPIYPEGETFDDLEETKIDIALLYSDGTKVNYVCELAGEEITQKNITRTTPILLAAVGCSRFTYDEFIKRNTKQGNDSYFRVTGNFYYVMENEFENNAASEMKRSYNLFADSYHA